MLTENRFLLVSFKLDAVLEEVTTRQRKNRFDEVVQVGGLEDAYSAIVYRIRELGGGRSKLGMATIMWVSHSERPLTIYELCEALGVEIGSTARDPRNIPAVETVLGCSLGLVVVEEFTHTVRLIHHTLQEYLLNNTNLFHSPHTMIAEVCLTYLNFQSIWALLPIPLRPQRGPPLLEYSSCYWGIHATRGITRPVGMLALRLLDGFDKHVSSGILLSHRHENWDQSLDRSNPMGFTGLHYAAYLGMVEIAVRLLEMKEWDLSATDVTGNTAISWAARQGHEDMVKMLLEQPDVTPDTSDRNGRTPLWWAIRNGHEGIAKMLLGRKDVSPNTTNKDGQTPLSWAARNGHMGIVKILLEREEADPNKADNYAQTPLSYAAWHGHESVVKILLRRDGVHPDKPNNYGKTPLSYAAWDGHEEVVEILLRQGEVNPDKPDCYGGTPLSYAAWRGHEGVVKILLGRKEVNPDRPDNHGQTPLSSAAQYGHEGVLEILLRREEVNPNKPDNSGRTPLSYAAQYGREGVVKILLKREELTPDKPDNDGQTPLMFASKHRHDKVVEQLPPYEAETQSPILRLRDTPRESRHYSLTFGGCRSSELSSDVIPRS